MYLQVHNVFRHSLANWCLPSNKLEVVLFGHKDIGYVFSDSLSAPEFCSPSISPNSRTTCVVAGSLPCYIRCIVRERPEESTKMLLYNITS